METCVRCWKIKPLCLCDTLVAQPNRVHVLILQHPQEPDKELGTARIANLLLDRSTLKTGLSVPNLKSVLGFEANPSEWIVLFLGSKYKFRQATAAGESSEIQFFNRKGIEIPMLREKVKGIVAIDGTWAQAKALWWRNPWLIKLTRAAINPRQKSLYGALRREPRMECLSTIESIAYTLEILGEDPSVSENLLAAFKALIGVYNQYRKRGAVPAPPKQSIP